MKFTDLSPTCLFRIERPDRAGKEDPLGGRPEAALQLVVGTGGDEPDERPARPRAQGCSEVGARRGASSGADSSGGGSSGEFGRLVDAIRLRLPWRLAAGQSRVDRRSQPLRLGPLALLAPFCEARNHLVAEQFEALAELLVAVGPGLEHENDLVDADRLVPD